MHLALSRREIENTISAAFHIDKHTAYTNGIQNSALGQLFGENDRSRMSDPGSCVLKIGVVVITAADAGYAEALIQPLFPKRYAGERRVSIAAIHCLNCIYMRKVGVWCGPTASHTGLAGRIGRVIDGNQAMQPLHFL